MTAPPRPVPAVPLRLAGLAALLPGIILAILVGRYAVNLPVSDEWGTSVGLTLAKAREGTLSLPYLFSPHTESRPFFPRLIALALNAGGGGGGEWDVRRGMVLNLVLAAGLSGLLWRVLDRGRPAWSRLLVLAGMNVLLFSPAGWEIWLWGQGYLVLLTLVCLGGTLAVNASGLPLAAKAGLNAALAFVGTFSFANGLLLWPLAWPRRGEEGGRRQAAGGGEEKGVAGGGTLPASFILHPATFYAAAAGASLALFFVGFRAADRAALPYALGHPGAVIRYFLTWCAGPFRPVAAPDAGHVLLGALLVGLFVAGAAWAWRTDRRAAWPWVVLGTFALLSGGLAAMGRTRAGLEFALSSRYAVTAVLLPVAALGAGWTAAGRGAWHPGRTAGAAVFLGLLGVFHARAFGDSAENMRGAREAREKARDALVFIDLMPGNPQLRPIFPDLDRDLGILRAAVHRFQAVGLVNVPVSSPALEDALGKPPPAAVDPGAVGTFDTCAPRGADQLVVSGWASDPAAGAVNERPALFVVFQWTPLDAAGQPAGRPRPWTVLRADRARPDVARALNRPALARCGFVEAIYRPPGTEGAGAGRVAVWAVDPASGIARPLNHTFDVPRVR